MKPAKMLATLLALGLLVTLASTARAAPLAPTVVSSGEMAGFDLLYAVDNDLFDFNDAYTVDNSGSFATGSFARVGYYVELGGDWVWASMDTFNTDPLLVGVPRAGTGIVETGTLVTNLNVETNHANVTAGTFGNGTVEFWASNYNGNGGGLYGSDDSRFDWKDSNGSSGNGHGSFQVFSLNATLTAGETVFGITRNGGSGLGDQYGPGGGNAPDWTFGPGTGTYATRNLEIWVRPPSDGTLTSSLNGNWNDAGTWTGTVLGGVPTNLSDVTIDNDIVTSVTLTDVGGSLDLQTAGTLTVNDGAKLTITDAADIAGSLNILNTGTGGHFEAGTVNLNTGTGTTTIAGTLTAGKLNVNKAPTITSGATINVSDTLNVETAFDATDATLGVSNATVNVNTGTLTAGNALDPSTMNLAGGGLSLGANNLTVGTALNLSSASSLNTGTDLGTLNTAGAAISVAGGSSLTLDQTLNAGTISVTGGSALATNSAVTASSLTVRGSGSTVTETAGGQFNVGSFVFDDNSPTIALTGSQTGVTAEGGTVAINAPTAGAHSYGGVTRVTGGTLQVNTPINTTAQLIVDGGAAEINAAFETVGGVAPGLLDHFGYHTGPNGVMDLNNNGGMMGGGDPTQGPTFFGQATLTDGPGNRGLDFNNDADFINTGAVGQNDNYSNMWTGLLHVDAANAGNWDFQRAADDDRVGIWIDLDKDGTFESSTAGLGSNRGEQIMWESGSVFTENLAAGDYLIAFTHSEGTGGSQAEFRFKSPTMGALTTIKPSDPTQSDFWRAEAPSKTSVANGALTITGTGSLTTGAVDVNSGGTVNGGGSVFTDTINVNSGGIYNANVAGSAGNAGAAINVASGGVFNSNSLNVLSGQNVALMGTLNVGADGGAAGANITMSSGSYVNLAVTQSGANVPALVVPGGAGLGGDLTNVTYGVGSVELQENAVLAATSGAGTLPTRAQLGGAILYQGLTDISSAGTYSLGDDGTNSIFKGGAIGEWTTTGGQDFRATVNDISTTGPGGTNSGIEILMNGNLNINDTTTLNTTDTTRGAEFVGPGVLQIHESPAGTDVVTRTGNYNPADYTDNNTTGIGIVRLEDNAVGAGKTLIVKKGAIDTRDEQAINASGTLVVGENASLFLDDNPGNSYGADRILQGHVKIEAGGVVMIDNQSSRFENGTTTWDFSPDMYLAPRDNIVLQDLDDTLGARMTGSLDNVNYMIGMADQIREIRLGDGRRLTKAWNQNDRTHDNNASIVASTSAPPTEVIFSSPGGGFNSNPGGAGGNLNLDSVVLLPGVDIFINDGLNSGVLIDHITRENDLTQRRLVQDGRVDMDGRTIQANDIIVRNGYLRFGSNERDVQTTITGKAEVWDNSQIEIYAGRGEGADTTAATDTTKIRYQVENDTLFPGGLYLDQGGYLDLRYRGLESASAADQNETRQGHTLATPHEVNQTINVRGTGDVAGMGRTFSGLPMTILRFDEEAGDGGNNNHVLFPNIVLEDGAHVGIKRGNVDREELRLGVTLKGNATMERENEEWSFQDVRVDTPGSSRTLQINRDGAGGQVDIYGTIGAGVTLLGVDTTLDFNWGADMEDGAFATNLGNQTPGAPGSAGLMRVWTGSDGNNPITGGTFLIGGNEEIEIRVNDALNPDPQIVNNFGGTIKVMSDGTATQDGRILATRGLNLDDNNDVSGMVVYERIVLDQDATAFVDNGSNGVTYNLLNLELGEGGALNADNVPTLTMESITGTGRLFNVPTVSVALLAPGDAAGIVEFDNVDVTLQDAVMAPGTLEIEIGGLTPGLLGFDQILLSNNASLDLTGATLDVSLVNGFTPNEGDLFQIVDGTDGTLFGLFGNVVGDSFIDLDANLWGVQYNVAGNDLVLQFNGSAIVTPEPSTFGLAAFALLSLMLFGRRRRNRIG